MCSQRSNLPFHFIFNKSCFPQHCLFSFSVAAILNLTLLFVKGRSMHTQKLHTLTHTHTPGFAFRPEGCYLATGQRPSSPLFHNKSFPMCSGMSTFIFIAIHLCPPVTLHLHQHISSFCTFFIIIVLITESST